GRSKPRRTVPGECLRGDGQPTDVESAIDRNLEFEPPARAEFEEPHAAFMAVAQGDKAHPGIGLDIADALAHLGEINLRGSHLTAPEARPFTMKRCPKMSASSAGMADSTEAAAISVYLISLTCANLAMATGTVALSAPVSAKATGNSFQLKMNTISAVAIIPGIATGATTRSISTA